MRPPTGYKFANGKIVPDSREAKLVSEVIYASLTRSFAKAAEYMHRERGIDISARRIRRILEDHNLLFFAGLDRNGLPAKHQGIISLTEMKLILRAKRGRKRTGLESDSCSTIFAGLKLFRCGCCGSIVKSWPGKIRNDNTRTLYYRCGAPKYNIPCRNRRMVPVDLVDEPTLNTLACIVPDLEEADLRFRRGIVHRLVKVALLYRNKFVIHFRDGQHLIKDI